MTKLHLVSRCNSGGPLCLLKRTKAYFYSFVAIFSWLNRTLSVGAGFAACPLAMQGITFALLLLINQNRVNSSRSYLKKIAQRRRLWHLSQGQSWYYESRSTGY